MISVEAPRRQGARREHTRWYVTDEQRSRRGCIGAEGDRLTRSQALKRYLSAAWQSAEMPLKAPNAHDTMPLTAPDSLPVVQAGTFAAHDR